jgi:hypothetical protein
LTSRSPHSVIWSENILSRRDFLVDWFLIFLLRSTTKRFELRVSLKELDVDPFLGRSEYVFPIFRDSEPTASGQLNQSRLSEIAFCPMRAVCERRLAARGKRVVRLALAIE